MYREEFAFYIKGQYTTYNAINILQTLNITKYRGSSRGVEAFGFIYIKRLSLCNWY